MHITQHHRRRRVRTGLGQPVDIAADVHGLVRQRHIGNDAAGAGAIRLRADNRRTALGAGSAGVDADHQAAVIRRLRGQQVEGTAAADVAGIATDGGIEALRVTIGRRRVGHRQRLLRHIADMRIRQHDRLRRVCAGLGQTENRAGYSHVLGGQCSCPKIAAASAIGFKIDGGVAGLVTRRAGVDADRYRRVIGSTGAQQRERAAVVQHAAGGARRLRIQRLGETVVRHIVGDRHCLLGHHITLAHIAERHRLAVVDHRVGEEIDTALDHRGHRQVL